MAQPPDITLPLASINGELKEGHLSRLVTILEMEATQGPYSMDSLNPRSGAICQGDPPTSHLIAS